MSLLNKRRTNINEKRAPILSDQHRQIIIETQIKLSQNKEYMSSIDKTTKSIKVRGYNM